MIFGMPLAFVLLFLVPMFYAVVRGIRERVKGIANNKVASGAG
jgi:hypothetical protein